MASPMAAAATHHIPAMSLPAIPRVRPPRIPKGTPGPNTLSQPEGAAPTGKVWADGRWREPGSNSAVHKQDVQSRQVEKALRHHTHGMNIYAYSHIRTNQVVYSLTKVMQNNKILPQLMFHGKNTVPASLRRDLWRPYFSIHFPQTPSGAAKGLRVFRELRELAERRQLSPSKEMLITTEEDLQAQILKFSPLEIEESRKNNLIMLPTVGHLLPKQLRAKKLMDQTASSVADLAAVLAYNNTKKTGNQTSPVQSLEDTEARRKEREQQLSKRAMKRLRDIRQQEQETELAIQSRQNLVERQNFGQVALTRDAAQRISMEYEGSMVGAGVAGGGSPSQVTGLEALGRQKSVTAEERAPFVRLEAVLHERQQAKAAQGAELARRMTQEVDQKIAAMDESERSEVSDTMAREREEQEKSIEALRAELKSDHQSRLAKYREALEQATTSSKKSRLRGQIRKETREGPINMLQEIETRQKNLRYVGPYAEVRVKLDEHLKRLDDDFEPRIQDLRTEIRRSGASADAVEVRWADLRSGTYASEWPNNVVHTDLQAKAAAKRSINGVRQYSHIDEEGERVEEQRAAMRIQTSSSPHVFGSEAPLGDDKGWYRSPKDLQAEADRARASRWEDWSRTETVLARNRIMELRVVTRGFAEEALDSAEEWTAEEGVLLTRHLEEAQTSLEKITTSQQKLEDEGSDFLHHISNAKQYLLLLQSDTNAPEAQSDPRIVYASRLVEQLEFEHRFVEAKEQANRVEEWMEMAEERGQIVNNIMSYRETNAQQKMDAATEELVRFDRNFPHLLEVEHLKEKTTQEIFAREREVTGPDGQVTRTGSIPDLEQEIVEGEETVRETEQEEQEAVKAKKSAAQLVAVKEKLALRRRLVVQMQGELETLHDELADKRERLNHAPQIALMAYLSKTTATDASSRSSAKPPSSPSSPTVTAAPAKANATEGLEGVEFPQPKQGIWGRVKGMFGR